VRWTGEVLLFGVEGLWLGGCVMAFFGSWKGGGVRGRMCVEKGIWHVESRRDFE
jgi:hypothetical protein